MYLLIFIVLMVLLYLYMQNNVHETTTYKSYVSDLHPEVKDKKIIFISDTHFREKVSLITLDKILIHIESMQPDLILFGGDIIHNEASDQVLEHVKDFFSQLVSIAPTYTIYGNHDLKSDRLHELKAVLKRVGVTVLENEAAWVSFDKPNQGFWLMGLSDYMSSLSIKENLFTSFHIPTEYRNKPKILLTHYPHFFEKYLEDEYKRPNLTLAGHAHGGQVRLPIIGGLFAPGQGANPYYDFGLFTSKENPESRMILTRGIGNSSFPFRVNNRPEIVVIEFE